MRCSQAPRPFISSMFTSIRIRSGASCRATSMASRPFEADATSYPHDSSRYWVSRRISGSSSTARIFCVKDNSFVHFVRCKDLVRVYRASSVPRKGSQERLVSNRVFIPKPLTRLVLSRWKCGGSLAPAAEMEGFSRRSVGYPLQLEEKLDMGFR